LVNSTFEAVWACHLCVVAVEGRCSCCEQGYSLYKAGPVVGTRPHNSRVRVREVLRMSC
jgi:hypothetical protein